MEQSRSGLRKASPALLAHVMHTHKASPCSQQLYFTPSGNLLLSIELDVGKLFCRHSMGHTYVSLSEGLWPEQAEGAADTSAWAHKMNGKGEAFGAGYPCPLQKKAQL